jgi:hypothetical protein
VKVRVFEFKEMLVVAREAAKNHILACKVDYDPLVKKAIKENVGAHLHSFKKAHMATLQARPIGRIIQGVASETGTRLTNEAGAWGRDS